MPYAFSNYFENIIINHLLRGESYTPPSTLYVALFTSDATEEELENGTLTHEVSGNGYERQVVTFSQATNGTSSNTNNVEFPEATGSWGTIKYCAIMDASTGGNILMWGQLTSQKTIDAGEILRFKAGDIVIQVD